MTETAHAPMTQITFNVSPIVAQVLDREAKARGYSRTSFAGMLFEAVYNERFGKDKQEPDLDRRIQVVLLMWGGGADKPVEMIAAAVGLHVETVDKIMAAWRNENSIRVNPQSVFESSRGRDG